MSDPYSGNGMSRVRDIFAGAGHPTSSQDDCVEYNSASRDSSMVCLAQTVTVPFCCSNAVVTYLSRWQKLELGQDVKNTMILLIEFSGNF